MLGAMVLLLLSVMINIYFKNELFIDITRIIACVVGVFMIFFTFWMFYITSNAKKALIKYCNGLDLTHQQIKITVVQKQTINGIFRNGNQQEESPRAKNFCFIEISYL
jgi:uncharacterized membrane protein